MAARCGRGIVRPTKCQARLEAERADELTWDVAQQGYVLTRAPRLRGGDPVVWADCPFCGGELLPGDGQLLFGGGDGVE